MVATIVATFALVAPTVAQAQSPPDNDSFASAREITSPSTTSATTSLATMETGEPTKCSVRQGTVWFVFRPTQLQSVAVTATETDGSGRALRMALHKGTTLSGLKDHDCYDPAEEVRTLWGFPGHLNFWAYPGTTYYIQVAEVDAATEGGTFDLTLEPFDEPEPDLDFPDPCRDERFDVARIRVGPRTTWYLRKSTIPSPFSRREVAGALKRAIRTLNTSGNDCGIGDQVGIRAKYGGKTQKPASTCKGNVDRTMVVEFNRELSISGLNCTTSRGGKYAVDSDIWLNTKDLTVDPLVNRCDDGKAADGTHDLEGVIIHELLHAHGLNHVPGRGSLLTMNEGQVNCSSTQRTLGLGDVRALRRNY